MAVLQRNSVEFFFEQPLEVADQLGLEEQVLARVEVVLDWVLKANSKVTHLDALQVVKPVVLSEAVVEQVDQVDRQKQHDQVHSQNDVAEVSFGHLKWLPRERMVQLACYAEGHSENHRLSDSHVSKPESPVPRSAEVFELAASCVVTYSFLTEVSEPVETDIKGTLRPVKTSSIELSFKFLSSIFRETTLEVAVSLQWLLQSRFIQGVVQVLFQEVFA